MEAQGTFYNWGYGPAMTYAHPEGDYSGLPSFTFEEEDGHNETVHLSGWHIHAPADHSVQGDRAKAELHLVHAGEEGHYRSVLAIRIDPGNVESTFLSNMPELISYRHTEQRVNTTSNPRLALEEGDYFNEFWTYKGSLTSPPCTEGVRWYMARNIMFASDDQMQQLLNASRFSSRAEQQVWRHQINV